MTESGAAWAIPYIDQPLSFWRSVEARFAPHVREVYLPLPGDVVGSGRPPQPQRYVTEFLRHCRLPKAVLVNPITLPRPVDEIAPEVITALGRLRDEFGVQGVTVADLGLARRLRDAMPDLQLTASVLMEVSEPLQALAVADVCDTLVPASRVVRDLPALQALRAAFPGRIRLLVNEACLPGCPFRVQHFDEMARAIPNPKSLCSELLGERPWLRLIGSWVVPQYLHLYAGVYDELKLAGRVTLADPETYHRVLDHYVARQPLLPCEIGGGPSSMLEPIDVPEELFAYTLTCGRRCHTCTRCPDYYGAAVASAAAQGTG